MSKVERIEAEIAKLSPEEIRQIARWLVQRGAELWDKQIEEDAAAGRLDPLTLQALREIEAGETESLDEFLRHPKLP